MKRFLIPLLAALALPTAVNAESIYLVLIAPMRTNTNANRQKLAITIETIPQESMEQCNENGQTLVELYSDVDWVARDMRFKCIKGK